MIKDSESMTFNVRQSNLNASFLFSDTGPKEQRFVARLRLSKGAMASGKFSKHRMRHAY
ncbi:MAG: hypothetical protein AAF335_05115 [Bacteroidota bacterium]